MSVFVALTEKGLPFELRLVDLLAGEQHLRPYTSRAPTSLVPTLAHDTFYLSESSAITEYLDEAFPSPTCAALYPSSTQQRAQARQLQAWLRSDLLPLRQERSTEVVFSLSPAQPLSDTAQASAAKLLRVAQILLAEDQPYLFGNWSIADTELALMLRRLAGDSELPAYLQAYSDQLWARPSVQRWVQLGREARGQA